MTIKICFIAPSGYGKSTAIKLLEKRYSIKNIKLATPLYELQDYFYKFINKTMIGEQDGELLQFLGGKIRKEKPNFLLDNFKARIDENKNFEGIITNDDCRPPDFKELKSLGFIFIKIEGFKRERLDHTPSNSKSSLEWNNNQDCDYTIENYGTLSEYQEKIYDLIEKIVKKR